MAFKKNRKKKKINCTLPVPRSQCDVSHCGVSSMYMYTGQIRFEKTTCGKYMYCTCRENDEFTDGNLILNC